MPTSFLLWLALSLVALLLEMSSSGLFLFLSFFFGALITAFSSLWLESLLNQSIVFLIGCSSSLLLLKFFCWPGTNPIDPRKNTNIYALIGKSAVVMEPMSGHRSGSVKIGGELWSARPAIKIEIPKGRQVEIVDVRGAHVIVKEVV